MSDDDEKKTGAIELGEAEMLEPWQQGRGGRPKGSMNKVTKDAREIATKLVRNKSYLRRTRAALIDGTLSPQIESMLWHYAYGKPKERVEVDHKVSLAALVLGAAKVEPEE